MKTRRIIGSLFLLAAVVGNSACSSLPIDASMHLPVDTVTSQWAIIADDEVNTIIAQKGIIGGLASVKCESDGCRMLLITDGACDFNNSIPILVNTAVESGITPAQCLPIDDPNAANWANSLVVVAEPNLFLPYMILGDEVNLAVPMSDGAIRIYVIPMSALRELIAPLRPDLFESPGWLNEHELEPRPDEETMDDDELILWRRGLLGI